MKKLSVFIHSLFSSPRLEVTGIGWVPFCFSEVSLLNDQSQGLLAYDWLYSRKPKNPI
ncbi:MAG: hypothetical protein Q8M62_03805 [Algoriphagus sp.]|uniref:hypothetical protein n=1 Tax=Algoriphagus sp. TaxID=1872435 RepID=UPI0027372B56|nr:hypothetical protein [Algoriphagus sp.]MDP3198927.1 hypothetical protein [Algoriphagus sp.]